MNIKAPAQPANETELVLNNYDAEVLQRMYRYVAEEVAAIETKNAALRDIFGSDGDAF